MIITFPVLVSETVDKDILPYLLKAIERKFALDYTDILQDLVKGELSKGRIENQELEGIIIEDEYPMEMDEKTKLLESTEYGIQVVPSESNKLNSDQPYFVTLRVTTIGRVTHDFVFGFKTMSLVTPDALKIFRDELDDSRYYLHRLARKYFGEKFVWTMNNWFAKIFDSASTKTYEYQTKKVLFSETKERICVLSANDLSREEFEQRRGEDEILSSDNLEDSRWSALYIDDPLNKRIYMWDQQMPKFSNILTYDMLYKNVLGVLPEQVDKAKQRNTSLFSKRAPFNWAMTKVLKK